MKTGKTLRGTTRLAFDTVEGVTNIVEGMYRNISAAPAPLGDAPEGRAKGIAGLVHAAVRGVNSTLREVSDLALQPLSDSIDELHPPGPQREAVISALNGICGDHLVATDNPLAIPMQLRVFLSPEPGSPPAESTPLKSESKPNLELELEREPQPRPIQIYPTPLALSGTDFQPTDQLLIMVHGLCMNDRQWRREQHNHADMLARDFGYTPVYLLYNAGQHISYNGREFADQLAELLALWPIPVESIGIIGHSMGGLVTRSALHLAQAEQRDWVKKVDKVVYLGSPHHGAALERGGFLLDRSIALSPYSAPLTALSRLRSTGITDLRHGNILDADWRGHDTHDDNTDHRQPVPLASGIEHFAIAATLSKQPGDKIGRLLGDGLVHPSSATGRHADPEQDLGFANDNIRIFYDMGHLGLLNDVRVTELLGKWLG